MSGQNPWNADQPFNYSSAWVSSRPIIRSMCRKVSGIETKGWHQYIMEKYLHPALPKWREYTDETVRAAKHVYGTTKRPEQYRCLILGSNEGTVERMLCSWGYCGEIIASDIADKALDRSREQAAALGYGNIRHVNADLNSDRFEGPFDFIIAEGVLHHIVKLDRCLHMLQTCLSHDGIVVAAEFVGPFRFQLPQIQVQWINAALGILPQGIRPNVSTQDPRFPGSVSSGAAYTPPTENDVAAFDPSEAISGHILDGLLSDSFEILERTPCGGTITTYLQGLIDYTKTNEAPYSEWMELVIQVEDTLIRQNVLISDYVFYVAKKRLGVDV